MEEYLEDRDYYALSAFITNKYIDTYSEDYEEYRAIEHAARYYEYLYEVIMRANVSADTYDKQSSANMIAEYVNKFYEIFDESIAGYSYIGDSGKSREAALEMEEQIHALLIGYCGLTKEDVAEFMSMSDAARALVIEERMSDGE